MDGEGCGGVGGMGDELSSEAEAGVMTGWGVTGVIRGLPPQSSTVQHRAAQSRAGQRRAVREGTCWYRK